MTDDDKTGTSECDGTCVPMCRWCLAAHDCPEQCGGGEDCPYEALAAEPPKPEPRWVEALRLAHHEACTCGGAGPGEGCPACEVWHAMKEHFNV